MDMVPIASALSVLSGLMPPEGLLYATSNYDGRTVLLPLFHDQGLEENLMRHYDESMECRTVSGCGVGGSRAGSRIYNALEDAGFAVTGYGPSDWALFPWDGRYRREEEIFLRFIVNVIYREGLDYPSLNADKLAGWLGTRMEEIRHHKLAFVAHQTDIVAVKL
jgi:hypothetical protein